MTRKTLKIIALFVVLAFFVASFSASAKENEPALIEETAVRAVEQGHLIGAKDATGEAVYIVRLQDAPLATYGGGLNGLEATSPAKTGAKKLNLNSSQSVAYRDYLATKQAVFLADAERALGRSLDVLYQYDVTYNGVALTLSPTEASAVAKQPGVISVQPDQERTLQTDVTPDFVGATSVWDGSGLSSNEGTKGEGIIIGVIDTGIWPEHPSLDPDGISSAPAGWGGVCEAPADGTAAVTCNNKLIGARYNLAGYASYFGAYDGLFLSPRDDNGHGTHTATTAGGNEDVIATLLGIERGMVSGIAPRAHIAAYKACGPRSCILTDLIASIDEAVADGVDVINYSIGGDARDPWIAADAVAFLAAREAGVFVATSAGNSGPGIETVGSPGNAPWLTTVGASTSDRHFISDITLAGPGEPPEGLFGASVTPGVSEYNLVDAEGIADQGGDATGRCINPYPAGTFEADEVVLCKRGEVARVVRGENIQAGGGGGVILYNADPAQGLSTDNYAIPAVHVLNATGLAIKAYLAEHPGAVTISFTAGQKAFAGTDERVVADMMAAFSARGPNGPLLDVVKPDLTAPGVQILAGHSPQCFDPISEACGAPDQLFQSIQGTSMSSPHVAGAAALLAALQPDWTPAEIESALMTTAIREVVKEDGITQADAFDMGAGRIDVTNAANAPLILNETRANYLAANPLGGGDPKALNRSSMANSQCVESCSWTRTVENSSEMSLTWDASVEGLSGSVEPASFTLASGAKQTLTVNVDVSGQKANVWAFGTLILDPRKEGVQSSHLPIAVVPELGSAPDTVIINTGRDAGSYLVEDLTAVEITELTFTPYGMEPAAEHLIDLWQDQTRLDPFDDLGQVWFMLVEIPEGSMRFVSEVLDSTAPDVDLFVGMDDDGDGLPELGEVLCDSAASDWNEYCNFDMPAAGTWWVLVQNYESSAAVIDRIRLGAAVVPTADAQNLNFDGPSTVPAFDPFDLRLLYNLEDTYAGQAWYGAFALGTDSQNPGNLGKTNVNLTRHADDVQKSADKSVVQPGDTVTFTIQVMKNLLNEDVGYTIVDRMPEGMSYVAGSAAATAGNVVVDGNTLTWIGTVASELNYSVSTNADNPLCSTPFPGGGYVDLEDYGILPQENVAGDGKLYYIPDGPFDYFGEEYTRIYFTDDGTVLFDAGNNFSSPVGIPQTIPNPGLPNNILPVLWQDMEIVYSQTLNKGFSYAQDTEDVLRVLEFDDMQLLDDSGNTYDFEVIIRREVDSTPGAYEIMYVYDNLNGSLDGPMTIGVENATGDVAAAFVNNGTGVGSVADDLIICFDWTNFAEEVTITYEVIIDDDVDPGLLMNMATSTTSNLGSEETVTYAGVIIGHLVFNPVVLAK